MINASIAPLLRDAESQREEAAIKAAYEAGCASGWQEALHDARRLITRRLLPELNRNGAYCKGLLMAINDVCDLAAGGRLMERSEDDAD